MSARLRRALSRDPKIKLGSLVALLKRCMQSVGKMLELLLATHFPNSVVIEEAAVSAPAHCAKLCDWQVAVEAVNSFAPCKSPGMDGIFLVLLQAG
jgi:hypothetical protein